MVTLHTRVFGQWSKKHSLHTVSTQSFSPKTKHKERQRHKGWISAASRKDASWGSVGHKDTTTIKGEGRRRSCSLQSRDGRGALSQAALCSRFPVWVGILSFPDSLSHQFGWGLRPLWWLYHISVISISFRRPRGDFVLPLAFVLWVSLVELREAELWLDFRPEIEFPWTPLRAGRRMEWQRDWWSLTPAHWWLLSSLLVAALNKNALSLCLLWTGLYS